MIRPPLILGTFHVGAVDAWGRVIEQLPGDVFIFRREENDGEQVRALAFHRALQQLRSGGFVFVALDPAKDAARVEVPFRRGTLSLARGAFVLSRVSGVPIVPFVARSRGKAVLGEPLAPGDERGQAAAAARWLERYLAERPDELTAHVRSLMRSRNA